MMKSNSCLKRTAFVAHLWKTTVALMLPGSGAAFAASPVNDDFSGAQPLFGAHGTVVSSNNEAGREPVESNHAGNAGGHSVWYRWHANCGGRMRLDPSGSAVPLLVAVYRGGSLGSLSAVASAVNQAVEFTLIPGAIYQIAVDGRDGGIGNFTLKWDQTFTASGGPDLVILTNSIQPAVVTRTFAPGDCQIGDGCTLSGTRQLLSFGLETLNQGAEDVVIGSSVGSPLFDYNSCNDHYQFSYYATFRLLDGVGQVVATGRKFGFCLEDTRRQLPTAGTAARYNCGSQGLQAGWSDVYSANLACQYVDVTAVPPGQYALEVHINPLNRLVEANSSNNIAVLPVIVDPPCIAPPTNDNFAAATILTGESVTALGDTRCATKQSGEGTHANNSGGNSIWYRWTAPYSGPATVSLLGSSFDTLLAVYRGSTLASLSSTIVDHNDDFDTSTLQSQVTFNATAGTTYRIAADGYNGGDGADSGTAMLHINPARNDAFTNALTLVGTNGSVLGFTRPATREMGEPDHAGNPGGHSVWFRWVAPQSGRVTFDTAGSRFDPLLAAYTGASLGTLSPLGANVAPAGTALSRVTFNVAAGTVCALAVDGRDGTSGLFRLNWSMSGVLSVVRLVDGRIQITVDGVPGETCTLEGSTNLVDWAPVTTVLNPTGRVQFAPQPASAQACFYRVVGAPPQP
jgi:hypothetical protein